MKDIFKSRMFSWAVFVAVAVSAYFVNVEVQSFFGRRAIRNTGLVSTSYEKALTKARNENKLVLVDVSAVWCASCRAMDNSVFSDPRVKKRIREKYIFSRIEYESEEGTRFLERHWAFGTPSLFIIDGDDSEVRRLRVTFDPDSFLGQL